MVDLNAPTQTTIKPCKTCGGTGRIYAHRSWFTADGYYSLRCGICAGSGESSYQPDPVYARFQAQARQERADV